MSDPVGKVQNPKDLFDRFLKEKTPGVQAGDIMSEAGRKILGFHFARMLENEPGTRIGEDIEALHDMRVATRRMRVALEVFVPFFRKKALKTHLDGLRSTGRALGRVRDLDVFLEQLNVYLKTLPEEALPAFGIFTSQWTEKRDHAQSKLIRYLDGVRYQSFTRRFGRFLNTPDSGAKRPKKLEANQVRDIAPIMIYERLAVVRAYGQVIGNATVEELHALRIQLKKLRYTVEYFGDVLGAESMEAIREIKIVQDHLGNLNDADVACLTINSFLAQLENEQAKAPGNKRVNPESILTYLAMKYDQRHHLIATFPGSWKAFVGSGFSEKLAMAISRL